MNRHERRKRTSKARKQPATLEVLPTHEMSQAFISDVANRIEAGQMDCAACGSGMTFLTPMPYAVIFSQDGRDYCGGICGDCIEAKGVRGALKDAARYLNWPENDISPKYIYPQKGVIQ